MAEAENGPRNLPIFTASKIHLVSKKVKSASVITNRDHLSRSLRTTQSANQTDSVW